MFEEIMDNIKTKSIFSSIDKNKVIKLYQQNKSLSEIGKDQNVSRQTISRYIDKLQKETSFQKRKDSIIIAKPTKKQKEIAEKIYKKSWFDLTSGQRNAIKEKRTTLKTKPEQLLGSQETSKFALDRMKNFIKDFKDKNGRLPGITEIKNLGNFDFTTIRKAVAKEEVETLPKFTRVFTNPDMLSDIQKLNNNKSILNNIKKGNLPSLEVASKIIGKDKFVTANRVFDLINALNGNTIREGISPNKIYSKGINKILNTPMKNEYREKLRFTSEKQVGKSVGEKRTNVQAKRIRNKYPDQNIINTYNVDEPAGVISSARRGTEPYGNFIQIIDKDINQNQKNIYDMLKSTDERNLQEAISSGDKKQMLKAVNKFNQNADKNEKIFNKKNKKGDQKIKLFRISLDSPDKTIANFSKLPKNYQEAFLKNYKEKGYSFKVPSDIKTFAQVNKELADPKNKAKLLQRYKKGNLRIYSQGIGPTFVAELPLYTMAEGKPFVETLDPLTFGAVNPVTYAAKKQAGLSDAEKLAAQRERNLNLLQNRLGDTSRQEMLGMKDPEYRALGPGKPSYLDFLIQKMEQPDYVGSLTSGQQKIEDKAQELRQKIMTPEKVKEAKTRYESFQKAIPIAPLVTNIIESAVSEEKLDPYQKTLDFLGGPKYQPDQVYKKGGIVALDEYKALRKKYGP